MVTHNQLETLSDRAAQYMSSDRLVTEEATKHALVLPFIQALGYDVFNPDEVVPEYTADFGIKRGEKVDYALIGEDGKPAILIECKSLRDQLDIQRASQLGRYFVQTEARIGVLTNGVVYKFFSDLDTENVMDAAPFLEIDLTDLDDRDTGMLRHFAKQSFNAEEVRTTAANMKHIHGMKVYLAQAFTNPDEDFVRFLVRHVYSGVLTQARLSHFTGLAKLAFQGFVNDRINNTLRKATDIANAIDEDDENDDYEEQDAQPTEIRDIVTTAEEVEAYELVKTIVAEVVDPDRVFIRDTKSYCSVILDDNRLKPICRFRFNSARVKHLVFLYEDQNQYGRVMRERRYAISGIDEIAAYSEQLKASVAAYVVGPTLD